MEENKKKKVDKIVFVTNILAVALYLICSWLEIQRQLVMTAAAVWGLCKIYELTKWKNKRKYDNFFNLFVLIVIAMVLVYEII